VLSHNRTCSVEQFAHSSLRPLIREVFAHERVRFGDTFPVGCEYRKHWEVAMACRAFRDLGVLRPDATLLGVGAGTEPTLFWLTLHAARVFATDLYLARADWWAPSSMLLDPGRHWPGPWNPRRLVVQHMDALDLRYEDASFDGIFSSSAIEHFGGAAEISRALDEMFRVLRPGGVLTVSTELRLAGGDGLPGTRLFAADELVALVEGSRAWSLVSPLEVDVSAATVATAVPFAQTLADLQRHHERCGEIRQHELVWSSYPMVVLREGDLFWTSVHLALRKHGSEALLGGALGGRSTW
jgi:SAM-dependent methyltransferase